MVTLRRALRRLRPRLPGQRPSAEEARPFPIYAEALTYLHIAATLIFGGALRPPDRRRAQGPDLTHER